MARSKKGEGKEWILSFPGSGKKEVSVKRDGVRMPVDILQRDGGFLGGGWF
jgi:hypothetical protein